MNITSKNITSHENIEALTNEEVVKFVQLTDEDVYWKEIEKRTKKTYSYVLREYVHPYYKETMREDILSILKIGWVKAVKTYNEEKATADFVAYCTFIMHQNYVMFARRINESKIGNSVRDEVMSNVLVDGYDNTDKMTQGCMENIMKYECEDYDTIEMKDYVRDMLHRLRKHDYMQYYVIKKHCLEGVTQKKLGMDLEMSQSAISRYIKKGLMFLKKEMVRESVIY